MDEELILLICAFFFGAMTSTSLYLIYQKIKLKSIKDKALKIFRESEEKGRKHLHDLEQAFKQWEEEKKRENDHSLSKELKKLKDEEEKVQRKEEKLDAKLNWLEKKLQEQDRKALECAEKEEEIKKNTHILQEKLKEAVKELERTSGLTQREAQDILLTKAKEEIARDLEYAIKNAMQQLKETSDLTAKKMIATAMGRLAKPLATENTVCTVSLPHQEMKGRIIGKEGRNIRALERELGVTILIDDTPKTLVISGFDPFRMYVAQCALQELIRDGRIHPTRIQEVVEHAREESLLHIRQWGEQAADQAQIYNLHPELIELLGKLKLRFSLGQNVLDHSLEVSFLMGIMAAELQVDERRAKRIGLLHDIGKAVVHEIEGSHALIGYRLALKHGETEEVANGIGCHHQEMEPATIEAHLTACADTLSATRLGARNEAAQDYIKRLTRLEEVAKDFEGVEKAFALQAGREVHIFVEPSKVTDEGALLLLREVSKRLCREFPRSGKIKVSVTREKKIIDYAL